MYRLLVYSIADQYANPAPPEKAKSVAFDLNSFEEIIYAYEPKHRTSH